MTDANDPKLDIWGNPTEGKHECFHCGEFYNRDRSTAPNDYVGTYCSLECYEKDTLSLKMAAEAEARFTNHVNDKITTEDTTEIKVGDFRIKVRKDS